MATIKQIAELAGVSRGTVDRVLNHRGSVNPETAKKVEEIARQLNYKPNKAGIALAVQKKQLKIGIILFDEKNPFFEDVLAGIKKKAQDMDFYGCEFVIRRVEMEAESQLRAMEQMEKDQVSGLIISAFNDIRVAEKISALTAEGIPVVTVNTDIEGADRLAYVGSDEYRCGQTAGGLLGLITQGRAQVGIITGSAKVLCHSRRIEGFQEVLERRYPSMEICAIRENEDDEIKSFAETEKLLDEKPYINALFLVAGGVYGACRAVLEKKLEHQIKIISYDTIDSTVDMVRKDVISATICQQPLVQGEMALEKLLTYLATGEVPDNEKNYVDLSIKIRENL